MKLADRLDHSSAFHALAQLVDVGVLIVTREYELAFINARAHDLLHCRPDENAAACWTRVQHLVRPILDRAATEHEHPTQETVRLCQEPDARRLRLAAYPPWDETDEHAGYLVLVTDLDALHHVEQHLPITVQMHQMGRLYEALAHDLRQPIGAILIHLKILEELNRRMADDGPHAADSLDSIAVIRDEVKELDDSLRLLLRELSPSDTEDAIALHEVVQSVARLIAPQVQKQGLALHTEIADEDLVTYGRRFRIKQAVLNLATNAIEAMDTGTLTIRLQARDDCACIEVADDGPGIPDDIQVHMFDRHYTTKQDGAGLGLHLVQQTAQLHGGEVTVHSAPGQGTTFQLLLPLHAVDNDT